MTNRESVDLAGAKVLMVDDVPAHLKVLREVLEPCGYRILFATRGEVALKIARAEQPDLILLDDQLARALRNHQRDPGFLEDRVRQNGH